MRASKVNLLKAKLVKLYSTRLASGTIEIQTLDIFQKEQMSLFHLIKGEQGVNKEQYPK